MMYFEKIRNKIIFSKGVPYLARKMMGLSKPQLLISKVDETWNVKTVTAVSTIQWKFKPGEEYEETMPNGQVLKVFTCCNGSRNNDLLK